MALTKVYIGATENLELYNGDDIISFVFTVTNADNTAYSFTGYTDINLYIYADKNRKMLVKTILAADFVISTNTITWSSDYSASIALENGIYYYSLTYEDATSRPISIAVGSLRVI
jgi:hypothetical protein